MPPLEIFWRSGAQAFSRRFDTPPDYSVERLDANALPIATPLWRPFSVRASDLGINESADITGFSVVLASGQIAVADAGELVTGQVPVELATDPWWRAQETDTGDKVESIGG